MARGILSSVSTATERSHVTDSRSRQLQNIVRYEVFQHKRREAERSFTLGDETCPIAEVLYDLGMKLPELAQDDTTIPYLHLVIAAAESFPEIGRSFYEVGSKFVIHKLALSRHPNAGRHPAQARHPARGHTVHQPDPFGNSKPGLFGVTSAAQRLGVATVVQSSVDLFLGGMRG